MALQAFNPVVMNIDSFGAWNFLRTCRRMVVSVDAPSIAAASTSAPGTSSRNERIIQTASGRFIEV